MELVLEKKSFINATASFQLRGQTGEQKMQQEIFNAYNAIEQSCQLEQISILFGNINNTLIQLKYLG
jgi:iron complex outermembrane receptor protein